VKDWETAQLLGGRLFVALLREASDQVAGLHVDQRAAGSGLL